MHTGKPEDYKLFVLSLESAISAMIDRPGGEMTGQGAQDALL